MVLLLTRYKLNSSVADSIAQELLQKRGGSNEAADAQTTPDLSNTGVTR
ncbi:MAG: transporter, partial [Kosakonia cowanii]|nr:transporter [Kosakonia cowanii]